MGGFFYSQQDGPHLESLQRKLDAVAGDPFATIPVTADEMAALRNSVNWTDMPVAHQMEDSDVQMLFRCLMQFARHLAKKYGFTIKQWPEK